jgi:NAD(P) transhydrogenase subunit alpha
MPAFQEPAGPFLCPPTAVLADAFLGSTLPMDLEPKLFVFLLSTFLGLEVIRRVSPLLHTPLMSLTNAISAIAIVAAIQVISEAKTNFSSVLGVLAVIAATTNIVGGFWITDRMLKMFRRETRERE